MIINNIKINVDNLSDWPDRILQNTIKSISDECFIKLIENELNRRREIRSINKRYEKGKEFILDSYGRKSI